MTREKYKHYTNYRIYLELPFYTHHWDESMSKKLDHHLTNLIIFIENSIFPYNQLLVNSVWTHGIFISWFQNWSPWETIIKIMNYSWCKEETFYPPWAQSYCHDQKKANIVTAIISFLLSQSLLSGPSYSEMFISFHMRAKTLALEKLSSFCHNIPTPTPMVFGNLWLFPLLILLKMAPPIAHGYI